MGQSVVFTPQTVTIGSSRTRRVPGDLLRHSFLLARNSFPNRMYFWLGPVQGSRAASAEK